MGFSSGNPIKDFVSDVKDSVWDFLHEEAGTETGLQCTEVTGHRRQNAGHMDVSGWADSEEDGTRKNRSESAGGEWWKFGLDL